MKELNNNKRFFLNIHATVLLVYGLASLPSLMAAFLCGEVHPRNALGAASLLCIAAGLLFKRILKGIKITAVKPRIYYITTITNWLIIIAVSSLVYYFGTAGTGTLHFSAADSVFTATASLTTTGVGALETTVLPVSLMLWRSTLNWLGGIGIILFAVGCLNSASFTGRSLVLTEIPGPLFLKSSIASGNLYRIMIMIYISLTAIQFILLIIAGMGPFDSLLTALSNISTSGVQHIGHGTITQLNLGIKIIITVFAFLGSISATFFIALIVHRKLVFSLRSEVGLYTVRILITAVAVTVFVLLNSGGTGILKEFGNSLMQTVSLLSTSGYIITDCRHWPTVCTVFLMLQLFIGACSSSTGGGIKTSRFHIMFETIRFGLFKHVHPHAVKPVRLNNEIVKGEQLIRANLYVVLFMTVYLAGATLLSIDCRDASILDALSYSQAMLTNTGIPVDALTGTAAVSEFSAFSKIIMSIEMLAGRLEIYPLLMLFFKSFWKKDQNV